MIYEMRFYSVTPGRMADCHARFTDHFPTLFPRHGVVCVGAWTALAGPAAPRFVYLLAYRDFAHREAAWASFYADPEWARIRAQTNAGHEMVERHDLFFLKPHAAWPSDAPPAPAQSGELHELVLQQIAPGQNAAAGAFLGNTWLPQLHACGARTLGIFDMASGTGMPQLVMLHAWPDAATWHSGKLALEASQPVRDALVAQRMALGHPVLGRCETNLLAPVPGVPIHPRLGRAA